MKQAEKTKKRDNAHQSIYIASLILQVKLLGNSKTVRYGPGRYTVLSYTSKWFQNISLLTFINTVSVN